MANHKSAKKRNRQNTKKREQNSKVKASVRTIMKKTRSAIENNELDEAKAYFQRAEKQIAIAAGHGLMHKKNASRKISRLASALQKMALQKASEK